MLNHLAPGFVMAHFSLSLVILVAAFALAWRSTYEPWGPAAGRGPIWRNQSVCGSNSRSLRTRRSPLDAGGESHRHRPTPREPVSAAGPGGRASRLLSPTADLARPAVRHRLAARAAARRDPLRRSTACSTAASSSSDPRSRRSSASSPSYVGAAHAIGVGQRHRRDHDRAARDGRRAGRRGRRAVVHLLRERRGDPADWRAARLLRHRPETLLRHAPKRSRAALTPRRRR